MENKNQNKLIMSGILLVIVVAAVVGYFVWQAYQEDESDVDDEPVTDIIYEDKNLGTPIKDLKLERTTPTE